MAAWAFLFACTLAVYWISQTFANRPPAGPRRRIAAHFTANPDPLLGERRMNSISPLLGPIVTPTAATFAPTMAGATPAAAPIAVSRITTTAAPRFSSTTIVVAAQPPVAGASSALPSTTSTSRRRRTMSDAVRPTHSAVEAAEVDRRRAWRRLRRLREIRPDFAAGLDFLLHRLLTKDIPSSLNKMRMLTEQVLCELCKRHDVAWGVAAPTLERMKGPLIACSAIPSDVALHVDTIQRNASPGSHYQERPLSAGHEEVAFIAFVEFLEWYQATL